MEEEEEEGPRLCAKQLSLRRAARPFSFRPRRTPLLAHLPLLAEIPRPLCFAYSLNTSQFLCLLRSASVCSLIAFVPVLALGEYQAVSPAAANHPVPQPCLITISHAASFSAALPSHVSLGCCSSIALLQRRASLSDRKAF